MLFNFVGPKDSEKDIFVNDVISKLQLKLNGSEEKPIIARVNGLVHDSDQSALISLAHQLFKDRTKDLKNFNISIDYLESLFKVSIYRYR